MIEAFMQVRELLAANIKAGRRKLALSQEKLAELIGISTQTISDIEGCRTWVSDKTLFKLSEALNVDIFQLLAPINDDEKEAELFLPQRISRLRQDLKSDIDKRLDLFLSQRGKDTKD